MDSSRVNNFSVLGIHLLYYPNYPGVRQESYIEGVQLSLMGTAHPTSNFVDMRRPYKSLV